LWFLRFRYRGLPQGDAALLGVANAAGGLLTGSVANEPSIAPQGSFESAPAAAEPTTPAAAAAAAAAGGGGGGAGGPPGAPDAGKAGSAPPLPPSEPASAAGGGTGGAEPSTGVTGVPTPPPDGGSEAVASAARGKLLQLFDFKCGLTHRRGVSGVAWNRRDADLLAVGYDAVRARRSGSTAPGSRLGVRDTRTTVNRPTSVMRLLMRGEGATSPPSNGLAGRAEFSWCT
jgi:hypothetical protein